MPDVTTHCDTKLPRKQTVFPPSSWKHVLKLLGLIIVADGKVRKEEVDTYLDVVMELRCVIDPTVSLTRHMARDWFILNKEGLVDIIDSLAYDTALINILKEVRSMPHKLDVITAMVKIAISDGDYANVEKGLIKKTILYWNISAKDETDIEASSDKSLSVAAAPA
jgi:uncharacterized tellurite resistance protein B-like protein